VVGTEQILHFRQLFKTLELTHPEIAKKEFHLPYELVNLKSGKMSSREGRIVTFDELKAEVLEHALEETKKHTRSPEVEKIARMITLGGITYDMLKQSPEKTITFDWEQALSFEGNAAPYLQYTHARACSLLEKAAETPASDMHIRGEALREVFDSHHLKEEKEIQLLKKIAQFPETIQGAAGALRPHYLATYAHELASLFNDFYQALPVLKAPPHEREARLALARAVQLTLKNALAILGIEAPESM